jgi:NADP-dependent 3-hydroxy acid dehydrogenase YdfG
VSGQAAKAGATVAMAARRKAKLEEASAHFGSSTKAFRCDVAVEKDAKKLLADARAWMDELDVVVFAAGSAPLALLGELDASAWAKLFATNVVGATNIVNAAMPQLRESKGTVALLSTHTVGSPWPSLAAYTTSKAALEEYAKGLHVEEPALRVLTIRIGNTATGFADSWEPERFASVFEDWIGRGLMRHQVQTADEVAEKVLLAIADREGPTELLVRGEESPPG